MIKQTVILILLMIACFSMEKSCVTARQMESSFSANPSVELVHWQKLVMDSQEVAKKIKNSVERGRLLIFLQKLADHMDLLELESTSNLYFNDYRKIQWQWVYDKVNRRLLDIQQNFHAGPDKLIILSILEMIQREAAEKLPEITEVKEVKPASPSSVLDEAERGRHLILMICCSKSCQK